MSATAQNSHQASCSPTSKLAYMPLSYVIPAGDSAFRATYPGWNCVTSVPEPGRGEAIGKPVSTYTFDTSSNYIPYDVTPGIGVQSVYAK